MIVAWCDVGSPSEVGDYEVEGLIVRVDQNALSVWQAQPAARFEVVRERMNDGSFAFVLDGREMRGTQPPSQHLYAER